MKTIIEKFSPEFQEKIQRDREFLSANAKQLLEGMTVEEFIRVRKEREREKYKDNPFSPEDGLEFLRSMGEVTGKPELYKFLETLR